jgi:hypothetical protein
VAIKVAAWLSANKIATYVEPAASEDLYHLPSYTSLLPPELAQRPPSITPPPSHTSVVNRDAPHLPHVPPPPMYPCGWQDKVIHCMPTLGYVMLIVHIGHYLM